MLRENIKAALASIRSARFRSFLTMLGVIIGVTSVITTASLGEGVKRQVTGYTSGVGSDLITVRPGHLVNRDDEGNITGVNLLSFIATKSLSATDIKSIQNDPLIETVVPFSLLGGSPTYDSKKYTDGYIVGTTNKMLDVTSLKIEFGDFWTSSDQDRQVAVIGRDVAIKLFDENVPLGKTFQLRGQDFIVKGVLEKAPVQPLNPQADFNNGVFIPIESAKKIIGTEVPAYEILARPKDKNRAGTDAAIASITKSLQTNHAGEEDFTVLRDDETASVANKVLNLVTGTVGVMSAVALLVGGVGIMNVMLVSVTERTREIGIRKAVGATNTQIRAQFVTEAVVISVWGVLIGLILSVAVNLLFRAFTDLVPVITWESIGIASLVSVVVGIVFGIIPAFKASRQDPIDALRSF